MPSERQAALVFALKKLKSCFLVMLVRILRAQLRTEATAPPRPPALTLAPCCRGSDLDPAVACM